MSRGTVKRKIAAGNLFNCSDLTDFIATIKQVLPFHGFSMSRFYDCEISGVRFLTKVGFYRKTPPEIYGTMTGAVVPHIDAEINILRIFKEKITDANLTPCILEMVYYKVCDNLKRITPSPRECAQLTLDKRERTNANDVEQVMCKYLDLVKNNLAHDRCAFVVLDRCDLSLDEYLRKGINTPVALAVFKSLLFQIIYTVYVIGLIYPGFRHYDLHTENIMLKFDPDYKFVATSPKFLVFPVGKVKYSVPYFGIIPKIIDFGFSALPEEGIVSNVTEDRVQMYFRSQNDLLLLFHWVHHIVVNGGLDKKGRVDELLKQLEPTLAYVPYYTEHIRRVEKKIATYSEMVRNPVWTEYRNVKLTPSQIHSEFSPAER